LYSKNWQDLFTQYPTLTTREFAGLTGQSFDSAEQQLRALHREDLLNAYNTVNGILWKQATP
jgi:putative protein-disulfide isomerase